MMKTVWRRVAGCAILVAVFAFFLWLSSLSFEAYGHATSPAASDTEGLQLQNESDVPETNEGEPGASGDVAVLEEEMEALEADIAALERLQTLGDVAARAEEETEQANVTTREVRSLLLEIENALADLRNPSSAAAPAPAAQDGVIPGITKENFPVIDGSTACQPLIAALYAAACGVDRETAASMITVSGTSSAWKGIANSDADIILAYEPDSGFQKGRAAAIGRDGLVFLTGKANPVKGLTSAQLRDIYAGRTTDWSQVGGASGPITAYQRNADSGSQVMLTKCLMQGEAPMDPPSEMVVGAMDYMLELLDFDAGGGSIGYSVYYYANKMYEAPNVKMLAVDGVLPSSETIADGTYPLTNDFYVAVRPNLEEGDPARLLYDWLQSPEGAALLEECGYVPTRQTSGAAGASGRVEVPKEVAEAAAAAEPIKGAHPEWLFQIVQPVQDVTKYYIRSSTIVDHEGNVVLSGRGLSIIVNVDNTKALAIAQEQIFEQEDENGEIDYDFKSRLYSIKGKLLRDWEAVEYRSGPGRFVLVNKKMGSVGCTLLDPITGEVPDTGLIFDKVLAGDGPVFVLTDDGGFYAQLQHSEEDGVEYESIMKYDKDGNAEPPEKGGYYNKDDLDWPDDVSITQENLAEGSWMDLAQQMEESLYIVPAFRNYLEGYSNLAMYFGNDQSPRYILQDLEKTTGYGYRYCNVYKMNGERIADNVYSDDFGTFAPDRLVVYDDGYHGLMDLDGNWVYKESVYTALMD